MGTWAGTWGGHGRCIREVRLEGLRVRGLNWVGKWGWGRRWRNCGLRVHGGTWGGRVLVRGAGYVYVCGGGCTLGEVSVEEGRSCGGV